MTEQRRGDARAAVALGLGIVAIVVGVALGLSADLVVRPTVERAEATLRHNLDLSGRAIDTVDEAYAVTLDILPALGEVVLRTAEGAERASKLLEGAERAADSLAHTLNTTADDIAELGEAAGPLVSDDRLAEPIGSLKDSARSVAAVSPDVAALSMELQGAGDAIRRVEEGISRLGRSLEPAAESIESARERLGSSRAWMDDVPLSTIALVAVWALAVMFLLLGLALVAVAGALRSVERRPAARPVAPMGARAGAA